VTLATRGRWPRKKPWERGRAAHLPPRGARAPPAPSSGDLRSHGTGWRSYRSAALRKGCLELRPPT
jgi:hypothetical protein